MAYFKEKKWFYTEGVLDFQKKFYFCKNLERQINLSEYEKNIKINNTRSRQTVGRGI